MTDPLGQSQVLPYLEGLSNKGHSITLLSFEKPARLESSGAQIAELCRQAQINWHPQKYTAKPPVFSALKDYRTMKSKALKLNAEQVFDVVHARGYLPAMAGRVLQKKYRVKLLFDMRGFWPDERVEGGIWNRKNPVFGFVYRYFKKQEKRLFKNADAVVSLTEAGKQIIQQWPFMQLHQADVSVIPCCADFDHFSPNNVDTAKQQSLMEKLQLSEDNFVLSYLGSIGSWYMLPEMLDFFNVLLEFKPKAKMLFISRDEEEMIRREARGKGIDQEKIICHGVTRDKVPEMLSMSHLSVFFIKPVFSKQASSPTKLAEILAMGIPAIANAGVGDVDRLYQQHFPGLLVKNFDMKAYRETLNKFFNKQAYPAEKFREVAQSNFSLADGIANYHKIYESL